MKGGAFMEAPSRLKAIAVDKTGTLTEGRPEISTIVPLSGHTEEEVLELAAAVEARSEHPLAKAVLRAAAARGSKHRRPTIIKRCQGRGPRRTSAAG